MLSDVVWNLDWAGRLWLYTDDHEIALGDQLTVCGSDVLFHSKARFSDFVKPRRDGEKIILLRGVSIVYLGSCDNCNNPAIPEGVIRQSVVFVPIFSSPLVVFEIFGVIYVSVDVDLGAAHGDFYLHDRQGHQLPLK